MMQHNLSCWPLVLSFASGKPDLQALRDYSSVWTNWLERGERFATLRILLDSDAYGHPPGAAQTRKRWLAENGALLKNQVIGMATVAPADVVGQLNKIKTDHLFGVPTQAFTTVEAALDWLLPLLTVGIDDLDGETLKARVLQQCLQAASHHDSNP